MHGFTLPNILIHLYCHAGQAMSMYNHADGTVQFPATKVYNSPGQGCTTAATYSVSLISQRSQPSFAFSGEIFKKYIAQIITNRVVYFRSTK